MSRWRVGSEQLWDSFKHLWERQQNHSLFPATKMQWQVRNCSHHHFTWFQDKPKADVIYLLPRSSRRWNPIFEAQHQNSVSQVSFDSWWLQYIQSRAGRDLVQPPSLREHLHVTGLAEIAGFFFKKMGSLSQSWPLVTAWTILGKISEVVCPSLLPPWALAQGHTAGFTS